LAEICAAGGVTLADCARHRVTKACLEAQFDMDAQQATLAAIGTTDPTQSPRDRLFDAVMALFDHMEADRAAWLSLLETYDTAHLSRLAHRARLMTQAHWMLEVCLLAQDDGASGARALGLSRVLVRSEKAWRADGPDLAKTMAHVDQDLRQAETWVLRARNLGRFCASLSRKPQQST
jgi:hypothetical protein